MARPLPALVAAALLATVLVAAPAQAAPQPPSSTAPRSSTATLTTGRVLVRWREGTGSAARAAATAGVGARTSARIGRLGVDVLRLGDPEAADEVAATLERRPEVAWAEP